MEIQLQKDAKVILRRILDDIVSDNASNRTSAEILRVLEAVFAQKGTVAPGTIEETVNLNVTNITSLDTFINNTVYPAVTTNTTNIVANTTYITNNNASIAALEADPWTHDNSSALTLLNINAVSIEFEFSWKKQNGMVDFTLKLNYQASATGTTTSAIFPAGYMPAGSRPTSFGVNIFEAYGFASNTGTRIACRINFNGDTTVYLTTNPTVTSLESVWISGRYKAEN
jgi:hypothetical protein